MRHLASLVLVLVLAPPATALPPPTQLAIARLIKQLGSPSFQEREAAAKALESMGARALPVLQKVTNDKDPEIRRRARRLVETVRRPAVVPEKERLYGLWRVVSFECEGLPMNPDGTRREYFFDEPTVRRVHSGSWGSMTMGGVYGLGRVGSIGTLDMHFPLGDGVTSSAMIYRLDGDTLQLCYSEGGTGRPEKFESRKGTKLVLLTLKRP
jgi:uncharacterized protein (TIGR03067 family)